MTPTLNHDDVSTPRSFAMLPSYRPVTMDTQNTGLPVSERPTSRCTSTLIRQHSLEQISQTSQQRSSEEDVVLSSGVHSVGDESDQVIITTTSGSAKFLVTKLMTTVEGRTIVSVT